jgi:hypothetical protein
MVRVTLEFEIKGSIEIVCHWVEQVYLINAAYLEQTDYRVKRLGYKVEKIESQEFDISDKKTK